MEDKLFMKRALSLAERGSGLTTPNPMVGAVVVKAGRIIGEGWHERCGGPHAEINAFSSLTESAEGATLYVTLEPCSHQGKTPPCVTAVIQQGIRRVVIAMKDPNPRVNGNGIEQLKASGIDVLTGVLEEEATVLNEVFIKYITTGKPFVALKTAMSLDGKIATASGLSKWITNETSRQMGHRLRRHYSAILVGIGTVLADDPALTVRIHEAEIHQKQSTQHPIRIILDSQGRIPMSAKVLNLPDANEKTWIATTSAMSQEKIQALESLGVKVVRLPADRQRVCLKGLLEKLGQEGIDSVLIEGGSEINFSFLEAGLVDKVHAFIAPILIGGASAKTPVGGKGFSKLSEAISLKKIRMIPMEGDILIEGYCE